MAEKAYDALAVWFEYLNDDCGYEQWSQYLVSLLKHYGAGPKGLDIGCGSGYFTRQLQKAGYDMTGIDCSEAMLSQAVEKSLAEGLRIPYLQGDMVSLRMPQRADFAVAVNDCVNYVPDDKILTAFRHVAGALKKGGLFYFDVSSEKKLSALPPVCIDDRDDVTYVAFNRYEDGRVTMDVSLFERKEGNIYERRDETHTQYAYDAQDLFFTLSLAGFEPVAYSGHLGEDPLESDRLQFLARRL